MKNQSPRPETAATRKAARAKNYRQRAKEGDLEAIAWVEKQRAAVRASVAKAKAEGRAYRSKPNHLKPYRIRYIENRRKAAQGDPIAQREVVASRQKKAEYCHQNHKAKGGLTKAAYNAYRKAAALPEHLKAERARRNTSEYRARLKQRAAEGDAEAIEILERIRLQIISAGKKYRARKRYEKLQQFK